MKGQMEGVRRILGVGSTRNISLSLSLFSLPSCISPPVLCLSPSFACSFSRSILLISWLKMSDTHVPIDQSCVHPHRIVMLRFLLGKSRYAKKKEEERRKSGEGWTMRKMETDIEFSRSRFKGNWIAFECGNLMERLQGLRLLSIGIARFNRRESILFQR